MPDLNVDQQEVLDAKNAQDIRKKVSELNALVSACARTGLKIDFEIMHIRNIGDRHGTPRLSAQIERVKQL